MSKHQVTYNNARGEYDDTLKKLTLLPGSILTIDPNRRPPLNIRQNYQEFKKNLDSKTVVDQNDGTFKIVAPIEGLSVSAAKVFVDGETGSGWRVWILKNGSALRSLQTQRKSRSSPQNPRGKIGSSSHPINRPPSSSRPPQLPTNRTLTSNDFVEALVRWIQDDPYHPPQSRPTVSGWDNRIKTYSYATKGAPPAWANVFTETGHLIRRFDRIVRRHDWTIISSASDITPTDYEELQDLAEAVPRRFQWVSGRVG